VSLDSVAVIPALDEEDAISGVVAGITPFVDAVVVADNGSRDRTAERASAAGAHVASEPERGYGAACLAGVARARELGARCILFLDGDGSDDPADARLLLAPVLEGSADLALGSRAAALSESGSMTVPQRFGNWLAPALLRLLLGARFKDLPPFKAIRTEALVALDLKERTYGFTVELLAKAHARKLRVVQRDVRCRARRGGSSKVSGTVSGTLRAGGRILTTVGRISLAERWRGRAGR